LDKPDLYVVARFLDIMYKTGSSMRKTHTQTLLGVNYPRFTEYLGWMVSHQFVEYVNDEEGEKIRLTPTGFDAYHRLVDWIKDTMEGVRL
jgi:predicted transcriptional regulator